MKKKLLTIICALVCVFGLTACGSEKELTDLEESRIIDAEMLANNILDITKNTISSSEVVTGYTSLYNKEEMAYMFLSTFGIEADLGVTEGLFTTYADMLDSMGIILGYGEAEASIDGKKIIATIPVYGADCNGSITFTFSNDMFYRLLSAECVAETSVSQKMHEAGKHMGDAGLNTLLGMGTVFFMLILICFIIASFSLFAKIGKKDTKKNVTEVPVKENENVSDDSELVDDTELVAVITAAISAYEGSSSDGFYVRSIKRANRRN